MEKKKDIQYDRIVLFDGVCNLCSGAVQFILKHEKNDTLKFASLQSDIGKDILEHYHIDPKRTDSIVYVENESAYVKSKAVLKIAHHLKYPYRIFSFFGFIPAFIANWKYDLVARYRYKLFGRKDECWLPHPGWKERFLDYR